MSGSFSANRTTDLWKMRIGVNSNYREDTFELTDSTFTNVRRDNALDARFIRSVGEHMGIGLGGSALTSSFRNQNLTARVAPAIEYNFWFLTQMCAGFRAEPAERGQDSAGFWGLGPSRSGCDRR